MQTGREAPMSPFDTTLKQLVHALQRVTLTDPGATTTAWCHQQDAEHCHEHSYLSNLCIYVYTYSKTDPVQHR